MLRGRSKKKKNQDGGATESKMVGSSVSLDGIQEANNVGECRRKILMPSSYRFKPEEQKVPDDVLVVMVGIKTGHHVVDSQLLLGVLQQRHKRVLATFRQLILGDCHVESVLPKHGIPLAADSSDAGRREGQLHCLLDVRLKGVTPVNGYANAGF